MAVVHNKKRLRNILFQVPQVMKNRIELRIFGLGFSSQSDYLKYLIRKDLDKEELKIEQEQRLVADVQQLAKEIDGDTIPTLEEQLFDI